MVQGSWWRAGTTALLAVALGASLHSFAGGSVAPTAWLALAFVATTCLAKAVQGKSGTAVRGAVGLFAGQVLVHLSLPMGMPIGTAGVAGTQSSPAHGGHALAAAPSGLLASDASGLFAEHAQHDALRHAGLAYGPKIAAALADGLACLLSAPVMLIAHGIAGLAVAWWIAAGERQFVRLARLLGGFLGAWLLAPACAPSAPARVARTAATPRLIAELRHRWLIAGTARRGPPAYA